MDEELDRLLHQWYPDSSVNVTPLGNGRVSAVITSRAFDHLDFAERQRDIWRRLRAELGTRATEVGTVYAVTPAEAADILT